MDEMTMRDLGKAIAAGEREPIEAVTRLRETVVYPRFLGLDDGGSFVWELADGMWAWGEDPHHALRQRRTFGPEDYVIKYGVPTPLELFGKGEGS